jgi:hypothetical protein
MVAKQQVAWVGLAVAALASVGGGPATAQMRYYPEHEDVMRMMRSGVSYLERVGTRPVKEQVLMALAAYKANIHLSAKPKEHPLIDMGLEMLMNAMHEGGSIGARDDFQTMYFPALAAIFLMEYDVDQYRTEIERLLKFIEERQQRSGAWGYAAIPDAGDMSQMQYICLALWLADRHGFAVSPQIGGRALEYLVSTQTAAGAWIYLNPPQRAIGGTLDNEERPSIAAAGLGSLYILSDHLNLNPPRPAGSAGPRPADDISIKLPPTVSEYKEGEEKVDPRRPPKISFDTGRMRNAMSSGNRWFDQHFTPQPEKWGYYFLYGFERYASMREEVEGPVVEVPDWYDQGVEFLKSAQRRDGSWPGSGFGEDTPVISTAFAVLFLTRSMQLSLQANVSGALWGGVGFPAEGRLRDRQGRPVAAEMQATVDQLLELLDDPVEEQLKRLEDELMRFTLSDDARSRAAELAKLRVMVTAPQWQLRRTAVNILARQRDLDNVPALIFALTDPDPIVSRRANEGLRYISRKVDENVMSDKPDKLETERLKQAWIEWYLGLRPDGRLLDQ